MRPRRCWRARWPWVGRGFGRSRFDALGGRGRSCFGAHDGCAAHHSGALVTLYKVLADWFPGAVRVDQAESWRGARPMRSDGPPVLGASDIVGVWPDLGHGSSGWALVCGSARVVADAVAGRPSAIELDGLGIERLRL